MPFEDRYGLPLSTTSEAAAAAYRDGLDLFLAAWPGAAAAFDLAAAADPAFALPLVARARLHLSYGEGEAARTLARKARDLVRSQTERERSHVEVLALSIEGQPGRALTAALEHLDKWPCDALVLSLPLGAFGLYAFSGMREHDQARVDLCTRHAGAYGDDWWFLTYLGWSLTENGDVVRGRALTEQGLSLRRENANAAHALAHAMYEDGSVTAADAFINEWLPSYDRTGILHGHIAWHQALVALELDDPARALALYAQHVGPKVSAAAPLNAVTDCASFLWRAGLCGHAAGEALWADVGNLCLDRFPAAGVPFADIHVAVAMAATGNTGALEARITALETRLAEGKLPPGPAVVSICRGIQAYAAKDYASAAKHLAGAAQDIVRIGGSHAQRDLVEDTLLLSLMQSGQPVAARQMLDERLHRRPSPRDQRWRSAVSSRA